MPAGAWRPLTSAFLSMRRMPVFASPEHAAPSLERLLLDRHGVVEREPAAVGVDRFPGDIACLRRSEEDGNRRDLVGVADAPERRARQYPPFGLPVGRHRFEAVVHDRAGTDGVDADAVGASASAITLVSWSMPPFDTQYGV